MNDQKSVLFLCTGNSCRSQMAEAIVNDRLGEHWTAESAGTKPEGYVHPKAIQVLAEWDIIHHGGSKSTDNFKDFHFDLVVTVCDSAAENCPIWLGKGRRVHHSFPDPSKAQGTEEEILAQFRRVRDDIATEILKLLGEFKS